MQNRWDKSLGIPDRNEVLLAGDGSLIKRYMELRTLSRQWHTDRIDTYKREVASLEKLADRFEAEDARYNRTHAEPISSVRLFRLAGAIGALKGVIPILERDGPAGVGRASKSRDDFLQREARDIFFDDTFHHALSEPGGPPDNSKGSEQDANVQLVAALLADKSNAVQAHTSCLVSVGSVVKWLEGYDAKGNTTREPAQLAIGKVRVIHGPSAGAVGFVEVDDLDLDLPSPGKVGYVYESNAVAFFKQSELAAYTDAFQASDAASVSKMAKSGRLMRLHQGASVEIVDVTSAVRVRVLSGDLKGKVVWTEHQNISSVAPKETGKH